MLLNKENYFSQQADVEYMSVSQWKLFQECGAKALATLHGQENATYKEAFLQGSLFEALVTGNGQLFIAQHPEMISSRGTTAGQLKAEYKKVVDAAEKFNSQTFFKEIMEKCEKQVILTLEFCDVKVKCCLDLYDPETNSIYDIKCMKDFKEQWSKEEKAYVPWYYTYNYVLQLAVYREAVKQNFAKEPQVIGLLAATKEDVPDIQALRFSSDLLDLELEKFKKDIKYFDDIKKGKAVPYSCNHCDYCKKNKTILDFEEVN